MTALSVFNPGPSLTESARLYCQAFELHEKGYIIASAIMGRVAVESYVNTIFAAYEVVPVNSKAGIRLRGKVLRLREEEIIGRAETHIIFRTMKIGNDAVHCHPVNSEVVRISLLNLWEVLKEGVE